jgi:hypothetical protein
VYQSTIVIHSVLRWVVILAGAVAVGRAVSALTTGAPWTDRDDRAGRFFLISFDLQVMVGVAMYFFVSPITVGVLGDMGAAMRNTVTRFWAVEHAAGMVVAVLLAHVGRVLSRRAVEPRTKHMRATVFYILALLLVFVLTPWPFSRVPRAFMPWFTF